MQMVPSIARKTLLILTAIIGISHAVTWSVEFDDLVRLSWKFLSIGLLAFYAALHARSLDGWLLTAVLLFSAFSDLLLQVAGQIPGALSFIFADLIAIVLYVRNARANIGKSARGFALLFVLACSGLAYMLPANRAEAVGIAIFILPLAAMVAVAWMSRFSRAIVGVGTASILTSDMVIFARLGPMKGTAYIDELIWLLYFAGAFLVALGVVEGLKQTKEKTTEKFAQPEGN
jgi:uncharacterized membrane protein YhhN